MWKYIGMLPKPLFKRKISLEEGLTPLIRSQVMFKEYKVFFKDETRNPTGSFRDRAASPIVSHAALVGAGKIICATDGNMGASLSAYSSRAGIRVKIIVPSKVDVGRLSQMIVFGADIEEYGDVIDDAIDRSIVIAGRFGYYQATAELNALSIEGLKTMAFEIFEEEGCPDNIIIPAGSGLSAYSIYVGFRELYDTGMIDRIPSIHIVQSESHHPIVDMVNEQKGGGSSNEKVIKGLDVREPLYGEVVSKIVKNTGGRALIAEYDETINALYELARKEGVFVEPAAATGIVAMKKIIRDGIVKGDESYVIVLTGSGLKAVDYIYEKMRRKTVPSLDTKTMILKIIDVKGSIHGYEVWKNLSRKITVQAVYQHLEDLERKGLVASKIVGRRRMFYVTEKGKRLLEIISDLY